MAKKTRGKKMGRPTGTAAPKKRAVKATVRSAAPSAPVPQRKSSPAVKRTATATSKTLPAAATKRAADRSDASPPLVIAGIGASAGGLDAFSQVLGALPAHPGLAIVLVQHLAPQHESALALLLGSRTELPVQEATEGMTLERDHVYVIPPNVQMDIRKQTLHLSPRPTDRHQYTPIDHFFRSLAESAQDSAIGAILSGTASDGAEGIREIKAVGGITIVQDPTTAKYDGMPRAAIATNAVDLVLSPTEIARELVALSTHPLRQAGGTKHRSEAPAASEPELEQQMDQIFAILRATSGVDFRRYKLPTIERRLRRRMVLHKLTKIAQYVALLRNNPAEAHALYHDVLIHVTRFFRDRETFATISTDVLPKIITRSDDQPVRIWVPGCSTGEEAYSIAILTLEYLSEEERHSPLQVFATDVDENSIEQARGGFFPDSIAADVSQDRLRRFFTKTEGGYRINKIVRDCCIFARQDLTRDPPFSKLDLILCRNVLIYMGLELQKKLMGVFHYALKNPGYLVLGNAETTGPHAELFNCIDRKQRIYEKRPGSVPDVHFRLNYENALSGSSKIDVKPRTINDAKTVEHEASRLIQDRFAPPGVIVDNNFNVVQFRGQTGSFLEPAPGEPSLNVLKMAREGLLHGLREALQQARKSKATVRQRSLRVRSNGGWREMNLEIVPLLGADRAHYLVLFDEIISGRPKHRERVADRADEAPGSGRAEHSSRKVTRLQQELASSREYLQSIIQDLEAANEELQSANEEVLSANEELQSTNEELDTAKEELQSTNEELNTVNEELHGRNDELSRVNSDLLNLLSSVQIAIVIVASDLRIRRFTPVAERVLNLIPGDIGRPISHIKPNIDCPELELLITQVIDTVTPCEQICEDRQGNRMLLRIRPYKNVENRIDGAVLALFDVQTENVGDQIRREILALLPSLHEPALLLDHGARIEGCNQIFTKLFGIDTPDLGRRSVHDLDVAGFKSDSFRKLLAHDLRVQTSVDGFEFGRATARAAALVLNARRIDIGVGREPLLLLTFHDA